MCGYVWVCQVRSGYVSLLVKFTLVQVRSNYFKSGQVSSGYIRLGQFSSGKFRLVLIMSGYFRLGQFISL